MGGNGFAFGNLWVEDGRACTDTSIALDRAAANYQYAPTDTYAHADVEIATASVNDRARSDANPRTDRNPAVSFGLEQDSRRDRRTRIDRDIAIEMDGDYLPGNRSQLS